MSPWISNLVVVRKKSGAIRLCVDLRNVNELASVIDTYSNRIDLSPAPLPWGYTSLLAHLLL